MVVVGLTGGIGTGKSTVSEMLARRGAVVCDADLIAREVVDPDTEGLREVVEAFGEDVVGPEGGLDREALAEVVFHDPDKRRILEAIIWPRVGAEILRTVEEHRDTGDVVVLDIPLLLETGDREGSARLADLIVVVATSPETQLERLEGRGMRREDAEARMAAQLPISEKIRLADRVIDNDGSMEDLERQVDELWEELSERARAGA